MTILTSANMEYFDMSLRDIEGISEAKIAYADPHSEFEDSLIRCIDCSQDFIWTAGEQIFFRDKQLQNPPKRCKDCKKAKNRRLEDIEISRTTGVKIRVEVKAECACCLIPTTVPFYPSQGRPVYCRTCFQNMKTSLPGTANGNI